MVFDFGVNYSFKHSRRFMIVSGSQGMKTLPFGYGLRIFSTLELFRDDHIPFLSKPLVY